MLGSWNAVQVMDVSTGAILNRIPVLEQTESVFLNPNGTQILAGGGQRLGYEGKGDFHVIEATGGQEIYRGRLDHVVTSVSCSPDGNQILLGSVDGTLCFLDSRWFQTAEAASQAWLAALRLQSGVEFENSGQMKTLTAERLAEMQTEVGDYLQRPPKPSERWQHSILKWSRMPARERTLTPWVIVVLRDAVGQWLMQPQVDGAVITTWANQAPWHPLEPLSLARLELKPMGQMNPAPPLERLSFLAKLTLKRLHDADEKLYGRNTLGEYAAWAAKIMHEELRLDAEAAEALSFALERASKENLPPLIILRNQISGSPE